MTFLFSIVTGFLVLASALRAMGVGGLPMRRFREEGSITARLCSLSRDSCAAGTQPRYLKRLPEIIF
jgi:hypothetical protein